VQVVGQVRIPANMALAGSARLVGDRAGGLVANNGGGLVSNNASGLVAANAYRLSSLAVAGVEGARVYLADQAGNPIPGIPEVRTDGAARFTLDQVPAEEVFVIVAEVASANGRSASFRTILQVGKYGATTTVDAPSTLVSYHVLDGLPAGALENFNPAKFQTATEATARNLTTEKLPDFTDVLSIKAKMAELVALVQELRDMLTDVRKDLAEIKSSLDALRASPAVGPVVSSPLPGVASSKAPVPGAASTAPTQAPADLPSAGTSAAPASAPSVVPSLAPNTAPSEEPTDVPTAAPSAVPVAATGCDIKTPHTFALLNPMVTKVGVARFDPMLPIPDEDAIFTSASVSGGKVTLSVPEQCPLQFFIDFGAGWMPAQSGPLPAGTSDEVLPL
jgi:hypothetical protein